MASFQAKIVWKRPRKRENKNYRFVMFVPDAVQKIAKKVQKKKKYHYGIILSQIVWIRQRKRENKNYSFVPSLPDA